MLATHCNDNDSFLRQNCLPGDWHNGYLENTLSQISLDSFLLSSGIYSSDSASQLLSPHPHNSYKHAEGRLPIHV